MRPGEPELHAGGQRRVEVRDGGIQKPQAEIAARSPASLYRCERLALRRARLICRRPRGWRTTDATMDRPLPKLILEDFNLAAAERRLCVAALDHGGNIVGAAQLLGITRHALKRRMIKLHIDRPRTASATPEVSP